MHSSYLGIVFLLFYTLGQPDITSDLLQAGNALTSLLMYLVLFIGGLAVYILILYLVVTWFPTRFYAYLDTSFYVHQDSRVSPMLLTALTTILLFALIAAAGVLLFTACWSLVIPPVTP